MIPNPLKASDNDLKCTPKQKFKNEELSCSFVTNSAIIVMVFGGLCILKVLLSITLLFFEKDSSVGYGLAKVSEYFGIQFFISFVVTFQMDILISAGLDLTSNLKKILYQISGKILSAVIVLGLLGLLIMMIIKSIKFRKEPEKNENWKKLKEDLKEKVSIYGFFIHEILLTRDIAISIFIIAFYDIPILQVASIFLLIFVIFVYKIGTRPFKSKFENIQSILNELLYSIILAIYFVFTLIDEEDLSNVLKLIAVYTTLSLIAILIVFNIGAALYSTILLLIMVYNKIRQALRNQEKVTPESKSDPSLPKSEENNNDIFSGIVDAKENNPKFQGKFTPFKGLKTMSRYSIKNKVREK